MTKPASGAAQRIRPYQCSECSRTAASARAWRTYRPGQPDQRDRAMFVRYRVVPAAGCRQDGSVLAGLAGRVASPGRTPRLRYQTKLGPERPAQTCRPELVWVDAD